MNAESQKETGKYKFNNIFKPEFPGETETILNALNAEKLGTNKYSVLRTTEEEAVVEIDVTEEDVHQVVRDQAPLILLAQILAPVLGHAHILIAKETITGIAQNPGRIPVIREETTEEKIQKTENP